MSDAPPRKLEGHEARAIKAALRGCKELITLHDQQRRITATVRVSSQAMNLMNDFPAYAKRIGFEGAPNNWRISTHPIQSARIDDAEPEVA